MGNATWLGPRHPPCPMLQLLFLFPLPVREQENVGEGGCLGHAVLLHLLVSQPPRLGGMLGGEPIPWSSGMRPGLPGGPGWHPNASVGFVPFLQCGLALRSAVKPELLSSMVLPPFPQAGGQREGTGKVTEGAGGCHEGQ